MFRPQDYADLPALTTLAARLGRRPVIGIVSISPIADDPRVRRQGDAFYDIGWDVRAFGQAGRAEKPPQWPIFTSEYAKELAIKPTMPATHYRPALWRKPVVRLLRYLEAAAYRSKRAQLGYDLRHLSVYVDPGMAETVYWTLNSAFWDIYALGQMHKADFWLANDWTALPIAARLAAEQKVPYAYDTHEFAAEEFNERRSWHYLQRPIRLEIERRFIREAAIVTTVSDGIAERLQDVHGLSDRPITVRSTPAYQNFPFRPTSELVRVLYHGAVWEHRGLEECIASVPSWRPEFHLTIRGPSSDAYRAALEKKICSLGIGDRVEIVPPVKMTSLVQEASVFDVGIFALPDHSLQNKYVLPNKFFEYTMAGLALCVSDLPEMSGLLRKHNHGITFPSVQPEAISVAINSLSRAKIDEMKQCSLVAASELSWENERMRMFGAYDKLFVGR
jgi:glycosyltransferase involved in cell wall biosynthesis